MNSVDFVADRLLAQGFALFLLPDLFEVGIFARKLGDFVFDHLKALLRCIVRFLLHRLAFDLQLNEAAVELVERLGLRIDFHLDAGSGLINEVDRLVGKEAVGDVAVREFSRSHNRGVGNFDAVVRFVLFLQTAQNGDRVLNRGLVDHHFLEAAFECGILFDVLSVFVKGGRADHVKFASCEGGLQHIAGIHAPLGLPRTDDGVELIDEENDLALLVRHFLQKLLEALLKFAAVLGARNEARHIERKNGLAAKSIRHFVVDDALSEPLNDGRLADARLADKDGVVLRAALQNLHRAANLVVAADHGVELPFTGTGRQVDRVLLQSLALIFRIGVVGGVASANGLDGFFHRTAREAGVLRKAPGLGTVVRERKKEHLGRDELVARLHRFLFSEVQKVDEIARHLDVAALTGHLGQTVDGFIHVAR